MSSVLPMLPWSLWAGWSCIKAWTCWSTASYPHRKKIYSFNNLGCDQLLNFDFKDRNTACKNPSVFCLYCWFLTVGSEILYFNHSFLAVNLLRHLYNNVLELYMKKCPKHRTGLWHWWDVGNSLSSLMSSFMVARIPLNWGCQILSSQFECWTRVDCRKFKIFSLFLCSNRPPVKNGFLHFYIYDSNQLLTASFLLLPSFCL